MDKLFCNILPYIAMKICKSRFKVEPNTKPSKIVKDFKNLAKVAQILPNLVTLERGLWHILKEENTNILKIYCCKIFSLYLSHALSDLYVSPNLFFLTFSFNYLLTSTNFT